jgi:hypothetical protein
MSAELRSLPPINEATGRPWICTTFAEHECHGPVVGAVGAYPVCANGVPAEQAARAREQARQDALLADPIFRAQIEREARQEQAWERRHA